MRLCVGTSGFSYKEWKGNFYPEKLAGNKMLAYYAGQLPAVEINATFYRMPRASVLETWSRQVPDGFRFALKASRRITHFKRLREAQEETAYLLATAATLQDRLGVILFQLPPNFRVDLGRLEAFLKLLPKESRAAFEFRHDSWFDDEVYGCLRAAGCALCIADTDDESVTELVSTAPWGYLRLRRSGYPEAELSEWADRVRSQDWDEAYVFFKHEDAGAGPKLAARFLELAGAD